MKKKLISKREMEFFMSLDFTRFLSLLNMWLILNIFLTIEEFPLHGRILSAVCGILLIYHLFQLYKKWFGCR